MSIQQKLLEDCNLAIVRSWSLDRITHLLTLINIYSAKIHWHFNF